MPAHVEMGTQFSWFYDVIAVSILLICIFFSGKKGFLRGIIAAVGCGLALALSLGISASAAEGLYTNTMRSGNIRKVDKIMRSDMLVTKYCAYLESLNYNIRPSSEKLTELFNSDVNYDEALCKYINNVNGRKLMEDDETLKVVHEGYAVVVRDIVAKNMSKYAAEVAAQEVMKDSSGMQELIPMLMDKDDLTPAAKFITDNYTAPAFVTIYKLWGFIILFIASALLTIFVANSMASRDERQSTSSHIIGGFCGAVTGLIIIFTVAAASRLGAVTGSNEMIFFNNDVVDKSLIFKYFYEFASKI
jgi:uncharacterized membrane protein required for colicin V production